MPENKLIALEKLAIVQEIESYKDDRNILNHPIGPGANSLIGQGTNVHAKGSITDVPAVGEIYGTLMKSGVGTASWRIPGAPIVAAIVVVNAPN